MSTDEGIVLVLICCWCLHIWSLHGCSREVVGIGLVSRTLSHVNKAGIQALCHGDDVEAIRWYEPDACVVKIIGSKPPV